MTSEKADEIELYFARDARVAPETPGPCILIHALKDRWNDFGFRTGCGFRIYDRATKGLPKRRLPEAEGSFHFSILDADGDTHSTIAQSLNESRRGASLARLRSSTLFFSLQLNMEAYRRLVAKFEPPKARLLLRSLHDLVAIRSHKRPAWYASAIETSTFTMSFMRESDTYYAFHNADSILKGLAHEEVGRTSPELHLAFKLPTFKTAHRIDLTFDSKHTLPKRIAALIGKNGVGKSQALKHLVTFAMRGDEAGLVGPNGERAQISRIIAVGTPGETDRTFPPETGHSRIPYRRIALRRGRAGAREAAGGLFVRLVRSTESIGGKSRWNLFREAIAGVVTGGRLALAAGKYEVDPLVELDELTDGSEERRLRACSRVDPYKDPLQVVDDAHVPLSSGQTSFISFAAHVCLHAENGSLLLIDEPETHLHPNLVTELMGLLDRVLRLTGSCALIATHSPHLVRELPRSQVHVLREIEPGSVESSSPRLKTFGAEVGLISRFVFGDAFFGKLIEELRSNIEQNPRDNSEILDALKSELPSEAIIHLEEQLGIVRSKRR